MSKTRKPKHLSLAARRQRELSWALFVTEGYAANLEHLFRVNAYTMVESDLKLLHKAKLNADVTATMFRNALNRREYP